MKTNDFKNKVALITGSSIGIGKAIAMELGSHGIKVVINGRQKGKLIEAYEELRALDYDVLAIAADIRYANQCEILIEKTIEKFGRLDIVVNNAAVSSRGSVEEAAVSNIEVLMDTNFSGSAYISKYAIPHLKKTKGHLIFINSVGGMRGMPYNMAYTSSKMAQAALAEALLLELHEDQVHVGIAYVGFTENDTRKTILDVDGAWIFLPKRNNIRLMKPASVAKNVFRMMRKRNFKIILTPLGHFTNLMTRHFPRFTNWLVHWTSKKIREDFTFLEEERKLNTEYGEIDVQVPFVILDAIPD
ncbi:MAG: SDR family NAD(P)-dependent oxidoreductase [Bacteroidia bacterium]|nr:SDR family NAD(P)-dependent oxidoreductase [Bacteroidia bacterium]